MNIKYMVLSDGSVAVVDENGNIEKRKFDEKYYLKEILVRENKIEMLDKEIETLNKKMREEKSIMFFCKKMRLVLPIIIALGTIGGFILNGLLGLFLGSSLAAIPLISGIITNAKSSKRIPKFESAIEKANQMKEKCRKDLSELNQKKCIESKLIYKINTPVSLTRQNEIARSKIEEELNNAYENTIINKPKKLVLKRKNNK